MLLLKGGRLALFPMGERSIVFSQSQKSLFGLDAAASFSILKLDEGSSPNEILGELATKNPNFKEALRSAVDGIIKLWEGTEKAPEKVQSGAFPALPKIFPAEGRTIRLLGTNFLLSVPEPNIQKIIWPYFKHLTTSVKKPHDFLIQCLKKDGAYFITVNGETQYGPLAKCQILPPLFDLIRKIAYQRTDFLLAMHACAVEKKGACLIFPGVSGSGKSTISAGLYNSGWNILSDEVAVVGDLGQVMALPLSIGLKPGSWPLLVGSFPNLSDAMT